MKEEKTEYEIALNKEIESRLSLLEKEDYDYGEKFNKLDWLFVGLTVLFGLALTIYGII